MALRIAAAILLAALVYSIPSLLILHEGSQAKVAHMSTTTAVKPKIAVEGLTKTLTPAVTVSEIPPGKMGVEAATYSVEESEARVRDLLFNISIAVASALAAALTAPRLRQR